MTQDYVPSKGNLDVLPRFGTKMGDAHDRTAFCAICNLIQYLATLYATIAHPGEKKTPDSGRNRGINYYDSLE